MTATAQPRRRTDLVVSRQDTPEEPRFVVEDSATGGCFRLGEAESAVARRLDGATPLAAVAAGVRAELGVEATPRLREQVGAFVEAGDPIAEVHDLASRTAEMAGPERERGPVRRGLAVTLRFRIFPERTFAGTVAAIAPAAADVGGHAGRIVRVPVRFENPDGALNPGPTGYARIRIGERRGWRVAARRLPRCVRPERWPWW